MRCWWATPSAIHASHPRKQKTDKRDARHILTLLVEDRFPVVWQPPVENERTRQLLLHRCRLVRMRTRVMNQLDGMAKNEGLLVRGGWSRKRRQADRGSCRCRAGMRSGARICWRCWTSWTADRAVGRGGARRPQRQTRDARAG